MTDDDSYWTQGPVMQYFRAHEGEIIPEEAKELLCKFIECGKLPYNPTEAYKATKRLNELGYIILLGSDRYSIVPKKLGLAMLTDNVTNRQLRQLIAEGAGLEDEEECFDTKDKVFVVSKDGIKLKEGEEE